jgi:hypothetical protein
VKRGKKKKKSCQFIDGTVINAAHTHFMPSEVDDDEATTK